jgi:hypothetical protein
MNVSFQYGADRIETLTDELPNFKHMGVVASTDCVSFNLSRPDLLDCLEVYAREEEISEMDYTFIKEGSDEDSSMRVPPWLNSKRTERAPLQNGKHIFLDMNKYNYNMNQ